MFLAILKSQVLKWWNISLFNYNSTSLSWLFYIISIIFKSFAWPLHMRPPGARGWNFYNEQNKEDCLGIYDPMFFFVRKMQTYEAWTEVTEETLRGQGGK